MKGREGLACGGPDFEGAADALAVAGGQADGRLRVHLGQPCVQGGPAQLLGLLVDLGAHLRVGRGDVVQALQQRLEVQHGAAHQQRCFAACTNVAYQPGRVFGKFCRAVAVQRVQRVDQVVRHGGQFFAAGFGRANVHASVNQGRVDADDFCAALGLQGLGQGQCRCGFAAGRGAHDGDGVGAAHAAAVAMSTGRPWR